MKNPKNYFEGFSSGVSRISRVWGRHSPTRFPQGQNERKANFGTAVESCSKKLPLSSTADFAAIRRGAAWLVSVNIAITAACPARLCSPLRTETENAKRSFGFFHHYYGSKPISGKLPRHFLQQQECVVCQKWAQKKQQIFSDLLLVCRCDGRWVFSFEWRDRTIS